jgi:hypothetical protein
VTNPRDNIDAWLERDVTPLMPPSGSLERIRRTARRRKRRQAVLAGAGCAVVVAAAALGPQVIATLRQHPAGGPSPIAAGATTPSAHSTGPASSSPQVTHSSPLPTQSPSQHTMLSTGTSGTAPPADFRPTSVTFVGVGNNKVVGAVIGQAGHPGGPCSTRDCTSLAGTSTYGTSWYGVSAPITGGPGSASGVSQLRFLNLSDGWAFGPGLWTTSQGGWPWLPENSYGLRVTDLEGANGRAFAIFAQCNGSETSYASSCTSFSLYSSVAGSTTWTAVTVPAAFRYMTTATPSAATIVIGGGKTAYLLTPSGAILSGPVAGGSWKLAGQARCKPGAPQASGQPSGALLAAGQSLVLACQAGGTTQIYVSYGTMQWKQLWSARISGTATSVASAAAGHIVLASTRGIYYTSDAGAHWQAAAVSGQPAGGFSYVGMTNASQGVAVPVRSGLHEVFVTSDGGASWTPSPITS